MLRLGAASRSFAAPRFLVGRCSRELLRCLVPCFVLSLCSVAPWFLCSFAHLFLCSFAHYSVILLILCSLVSWFLYSVVPRFLDSLLHLFSVSFVGAFAPWPPVDQADQAVARALRGGGASRIPSARCTLGHSRAMQPCVTCGDCGVRLLLSQASCARNPWRA